MHAALNVNANTFPFADDSKNMLIAKQDGLSVYYAPFEHINSVAKVAIIGLTPGRHQAMNAFAELQTSYDICGDWLGALTAAKKHASFSGPMRANLIRMLDSIRFNELMGITSCSKFFDENCNLAHFTSAVRNPVFNKGANFSGTPAIEKNTLLYPLAKKWLCEELRQLKDAYLIPLGPKVESLLQKLIADQELPEMRILAGLPHPSGANAERISYFLGTKSRADLSSKTNPDKIEISRRNLTTKIDAFIAEANGNCSPPLCKDVVK